MAIIQQRDAELFQERANPEEALKTKINMIASTILKVEENKTKFVNALALLKHDLIFPPAFKDGNYIIDDMLVARMALQNPAGMRIGAVDGSVLRESLVGADIIASKARGVAFRFYTKKPPVVKYFPREKNENFNLFGIFQGSNSQELEIFTNAERLLSELELVHSIISTESHLDMMIIDGSLFIPEIFNNKENLYANKYSRQISEILVKILKACRENDTMLVGVMKDSAKMDFVNIIGKLIPTCMNSHPAFKKFLDFDYRQAIQVFKDYDLFFRYLKEGERTFAMKEFPKAEDFIPSTDFERYLKNNDLALYTYIFKAVPMDIPLKVEFFAKNRSDGIKPIVERTSSLLYPLSRVNVDYSEPSPQMEAHKRVKIPEQDFKVIIETIRQKTGFCSTLMQKRRDRRPF
ncbi:MAG TPA: DNA double-strand break repair nuclease NurA [Candidatus Lokiarchaeia archaeon]|nr:DNA double-strand break repair nuclease NurA [Candidatus Lokiarchaeia archaeon]